MDSARGRAVPETRDCGGLGAFSGSLSGAPRTALDGLYSFQNLLMISFLPFPLSSSFLPFLLCLFLFLISEESSDCKEEGRCMASPLFPSTGLRVPLVCVKTKP